MSEHITIPAHLVAQMKRLEPQHCPLCTRSYEDKDVKLVGQIKWHCFCGYCGAIYFIEVEA